MCVKKGILISILCLIPFLSGCRPSVTFKAEPASIQVGESTILSWTTYRAKTVYINNGIGYVQLNGSIKISPSETTYYTLTATGSSGFWHRHRHRSRNTYRTIMVKVNPRPGDIDNDGLSDEWENNVFGNINQHQNDDYDHDGFTNFVEYVAGTDATEKNDKPEPGNFCKYDELGRLEAVIQLLRCEDSFQIQYRYDSKGNRIKKTTLKFKTPYSVCRYPLSSAGS